MRVILSRSHDRIDAESGIVFIEGPEGFSASLTPGAARQMGRYLIGAARVARQQNQGKPIKPER